MALDKLKVIIQQMFEAAKASPADTTSVAAYYDGQELAYQSVLDIIENMEEEEKKEKEA